MAASNPQSIDPLKRTVWSLVFIGGFSFVGYSLFSGSLVSYSAPGSHEHNGAKFVGVEVSPGVEDDPEIVRQGAETTKRLENLHKRMDENKW